MRQLWAGIVIGLVLSVSPALAGPHLDELRGHLGVGYASLRGVDEAPSGSLSVSAGLDYPIGHTLRLGTDVGYDLLGTRTVDRGSLVAELDYSVFEALALVHWFPAIPLVQRISFGMGVFNARADLSSSGAAAFSDLAVEQTTRGIGFQATLMKHKPSPVRVGVEVGWRQMYMRGDDWSLVNARLAIHY